MDLGEAALLALLEAGGPAAIIVGVTGGQGFLFGRGNQAISAEVIRRVGRQNITVLAGAEKLAALDPPCLRGDTGDPEVDRLLAGFIRVRTAPGRASVMRVVA